MIEITNQAHSIFFGLSKILKIIMGVGEGYSFYCNNTVHFLIFNPFFLHSPMKVGGGTPYSFNFLYVNYRKNFAAQKKGGGWGYRPPPHATCLLLFQVPTFLRFIFFMHQRFSSKHRYVLRGFFH